jgi:outer membrane biosynthesis protein TonB
MEFKSATVISGCLHAAVLLWAMVSFAGHRLEATPVESLPVDLVSEKQFSELTKGIKEAPKPVEKPKPLVEKKDEPKPITAADIVAKLTPKKEIKATAEKPPEPKTDAIAEKIKKEQQEEQKHEAKAEPKPLPPKRPQPKPQPKFNPDKIAALLDKRAPQREAIAGNELNQTPTLGTALGNASKLSQSEIDALRARLMALWNPPVGIQNPEDYVVRIRMQIGRDGRLTTPPIVLSSGHGQIFVAARDSAVRAVFRAQPFDMLRPEHYDTWKDIEVTFDPRDMFRG